jgi:hypothetical protein
LIRGSVRRVTALTSEAEQMVRQVPGLLRIAVSAHNRLTWANRL